MMVGAILSKTPNYGFSKVRFDMPGWHGVEHDNWSLTDALLASIGSIPGSRGVWTNATAYTAGDRVADPDIGGLYRCAVSHVSSSISTFDADRIANPTYWVLITQVPVDRGMWATAVSYSTQDIVRYTNAYYYCVAAHIAGTFATDLASGKWTLIFDLQDAIDAQTAAEAAAVSAVADAAAADASAADALASENAASASASAASASESAAAGSAAAASGSAAAADTDAATATAQAGIATTQANNAATSAAAALVSENNAATSAATIANDKVQPGALEFYLMANAPAGRLKANGALATVATYAALTTAIYCGDADNATASWGYRTNSGDTVRSTTGTHIRLPDWRGEFTRGFDDGRGIDSGRSLWAAQAQAIQSHTHTVADPGHGHGLVGGPNAPGSGTAGPALQSNNSTSGNGVVGSTTGITIPSSGGGAETRPRNQAALACIKY